MVSQDARIRNAQALVRRAGKGETAAELPQMIRHVLLLQPRSDSTPQAIEACRRALIGLVGRIPGLLDCHWGENLAAPERREGFTHGFSMDFVDRASLDAYGPHPDHKPVATLVRGTFDRIVTFDFVL